VGCVSRQRLRWGGGTRTVVRQRVVEVVLSQRPPLAHGIRTHHPAKPAHAPTHARRAPAGLTGEDSMLPYDSVVPANCLKILAASPACAAGTLVTHAQRAGRITEGTGQQGGLAWVCRSGALRPSLHKSSCTAGTHAAVKIRLPRSHGNSGQLGAPRSHRCGRGGRPLSSWAWRAPSQQDRGTLGGQGCLVSGSRQARRRGVSLSSRVGAIQGCQGSSCPALLFHAIGTRIDRP
jgi:hypothetical protein